MEIGYWQLYRGLYQQGKLSSRDKTVKFLSIERYASHVQVQIVQLDEDRGELMHRATFDHPYPTTKVMWIPDPATHYPDLLATSGDYLRLWRVGNGEVHQECMLNNVSISNKPVSFGIYVYVLCDIVYILYLWV